MFHSWNFPPKTDKSRKMQPTPGPKTLMFCRPHSAPVSQTNKTRTWSQGRETVASRLAAKATSSLNSSSYIQHCTAHRRYEPGLTSHTHTHILRQTDKDTMCAPSLPSTPQSSDNNNCLLSSLCSAVLSNACLAQLPKIIYYPSNDKARKGKKTWRALRHAVQNVCFPGSPCSRPHSLSQAVL